MVKEIVWSDQAIIEFDNIIAFLESEWGKKEIRNFIFETERVLDFISEHPFIFRNTKYHNIREALVNRIIYW